MIEQIGILSLMVVSIGLSQIYKPLGITFFGLIIFILCCLVISRGKEKDQGEK